ncbi:hypothetical protein C8T65DRAFT_109296 [Cerioporus squamosus]|nr:hypothetical protein C8T65DRAFT_109296 [Cerioporus squamosus]
MGQANSRSSPAPDASRPARQPAPSPSIPAQRERTDSAATAASASSKRSRRESLGRTVRGLLPHSRSAQDGHSSHDPSSSIRKRWRSSRRFTKQPSSLSDPPEAHPNPDSGTGPSASPHSSQDHIPEDPLLDLPSAAPVQSLLSPLPCAIVAHPSPMPPPPSHAPVQSLAPEPRSSSDHVNQPESPDELDPSNLPAQILSQAPRKTTNSHSRSNTTSTTFSLPTTQITHSSRAAREMDNPHHLHLLPQSLLHLPVSHSLTLPFRSLRINSLATSNHLVRLSSYKAW